MDVRRRFLRSRWRIACAICLVIVVGWLFALSAGHALVVEEIHTSDALVVLGGDTNDRRYYRGLELLREGRARVMLVSGAEHVTFLGRSGVEWTEQFVKGTAGELVPRVKVCPNRANSTVSETEFVNRCLIREGARSALIVTSDFHTRRSLSIFKARLPQYHWSVAAASDPLMFGQAWWRNRQWTKTTLEEWGKVLYWHIVDRWRS